MGVADVYSDLLGALLLDPWGPQAACIGKAHILEGDDEQAAKKLCFGDATRGIPPCPVINDCHRWVIPLGPHQDPGGVRAGRTEQERNDFRKGRTTRPRTEPTKLCPSCRQTKKASEFHRHHSRKDGLSSYCKPCNNAVKAAGRARKAAA